MPKSAIQRLLLLLPLIASSGVPAALAAPTPSRRELGLAAIEYAAAKSSLFRAELEAKADLWQIQSDCLQEKVSFWEETRRDNRNRSIHAPRKR